MDWRSAKLSQSMTSPISATSVAEASGSRRCRRLDRLRRRVALARKEGTTEVFAHYPAS